MEAKSGINHWVVVMAAAVTVGVGFLWYLEPVFGGHWMDVVGLPRTISAPLIIILLGMALKGGIALGAAYALTAVMRKTTAPNVKEGAFIGLALGFISLTLLVDGFFAGRPVSTFLIDGGFQLLSFTLMGAILGGWGRKDPITE